MDQKDRIYIAGHTGLIGSAIFRRLSEQGFSNLISRSHAEVDLSDTAQTFRLFESQRPQYVFLAAAKVGGILANSSFPADFIRENLRIQTNVIEAAHAYGVKRLLFLGSSCIYPKLAPQPIREEYLLSGPLEATNQAYAVAKLAGIEMCRAYSCQFGDHFISALPTNLYGVGDDFDLQTAHVLPALLRRFHEAKESGAKSVTVWGTGKPQREFLYADDAADALILLMQEYEEEEVINVGTGQDISVADLAALIAEVTEFQGEVVFDASKPDGTPRKVLDVSKLHKLGWEPRTKLREGIEKTYAWFQTSAWNLGRAAK